MTFSTVPDGQLLRRPLYAGCQIPVGVWFLAPVFIPTLIFSVVLVLAAALIPDQTNAVFSGALAVVTDRFGWLTMLVASAMLVFLVVIALSPWGKIRLGPDHSRPRYSFWVWFAMLFAAGHGVALVFFGVAEPVIHYATPPQAGLEGLDAAREAMQISFFHWGFHLWAIYGIVGIALAYFSFRHGLPLSVRSALYPLIGDRIYGPIGHAVDVFAALGTLFGLSTSLGVSAMQINAGLSHVFPSIPALTSVQVVILAIITALTLISVVLGLDAGIKRLSTFNLTLAFGLMAFVFVFGPTVYILEVYLENISAYVGGVVERTLYLSAHHDKSWMAEWTLFIFSWIIAWAPFVGLFIARISYGRTIREFVFGVLVVPTIATLFWFTTFGGTALHMITQGGDTALLDAISSDLSVALFEVLERLPLSGIAIPLSLVLSGIFFVTSADSGALVVDSLTAGGAEVNAPTPSEMITLHVSDGEKVDFVYEIRAITEGPEPKAEVFLKRGGQEYDVYGLEENELIADVLDQLERYLHFIREVGESLPWEAREEV